MKMKCLLIIWFAVGQLWASPGDAGAIFLLIAPGAGPAGVGEAQVAKADDAYASFYNPAGLGFLKGKEAAGMHVQWLPYLADDLYYEFMTYRHEIPGLGTLGGHIIYLNLGKQIATDDRGNVLGDFPSWMGAVTLSFGSIITPSSSIGLNYKIFHQALAPFGAGIEDGDGSSTDFGFDIGYLKKFKQSTASIKIKKQKKLKHLFDQLIEIYDRQNKLNDQISFMFKEDDDGYEIMEEQRYIHEDLEGVRAKLLRYNTMESYSILDEKLFSAIIDIDELINSFTDLQEEEIIPSTIENFEDSTSIMMDRILFDLLEVETIRGSLLAEVESEEIQDIDDKFNFGISISNIGPKIDFIDAAQADPAPTNMRIGILANIYNDGNNKINFLFDANKLMVARYPAMDWNGDGIISGDKEIPHDDPWYLAIFTAWLDGWYFGGDLDENGDNFIGGYDCPTGAIAKSLDQYKCDSEWESTFDKDYNDSDYGIYSGELDNYGNAKIEKGSGSNRSFKTELEETIYNMGIEYWYTSSFVLRAGYMYDYEGKVINPTFGAGIRLLQYGFDFGYTAGSQKQENPSRINTMFFSINIVI